MERLEKEIVVSEGKKPFWQLIIAALLYTVALICLFYFIVGMSHSGADPEMVKKVIGFLKLAIFAIVGALNFSVIKTLYINFEKEKLKTEFSVGPFAIKYYSKIPQLEYVSVFKNPQTEIFEVNLWYKGNKHFNVACFVELEPANDFGLMFSNKLNLDLLDATEKGDSKWVEKVTPAILQA